jgi:hypothetical protein
MADQLQIDLVGVPWLVISDELSRAPNGGYTREGSDRL